MSIILKDTSFGLLRTNPLLTTNIKIVTDENNVYLESIDAEPILADNRLKAFNVTGGLYSTDLFKFYNRDNLQLPKSIAYKVKDPINSNFKKSPNEQYDFTYCYGTEYKKSNLYKQSISTFAPLWLNPLNIPDYFVIFKLPGSNSVDESILSSSEIENEIINPDNFFRNYIKDAQILKTFDLTKRTQIGKYIRKYAEQEDFPKSPLFASIKKGELSYTNGISYETGGFCKKAININQSFVLVDRTVIEKDNYLTSRFFETGLVVSNILNLEFLYDDPSIEDFKFNRYFGFYVSESELSQLEFDLTLTKAYNQIDVLETNQVKDTTISNDKGIILGFKKSNTDLDELTEYLPRFSYLKNINNKFYSISQENQIDNNNNNSTYIRLKTKEVQISDLIPLEQPIKYIDSYGVKSTSPASFSFKVLSRPISGDQIRIVNTDVEDELTLFYTITGDDSLEAGKNNGLSFSIKGSLDDIALSITKSINQISNISNKTQSFVALNIKNRVVVYTYSKTSYLNKIKYSIFSAAEEFPFSIPNINGKFEFVEDYKDYKNSTNLFRGNLFTHTFTGGSNELKTRAFTETSNLFELFQPKKSVKSENSIVELLDYAPYLEEPLFNDNGEIIDFKGIEEYFIFYTKNSPLEIVSNQIGLYEIDKFSCGHFSIYPIRDFDFDFYSEQYNKQIDSNIENLKSYYTDDKFSNLINKDYINYIIDSINFKTVKKALVGQFDESTNSYLSVTSEYQRLRETDISDFATYSKTIPFVNKWVYIKDSIDIRENPYRLNASRPFDYFNFTPAFKDFGINEFNHTHEWYYLQKYPPYFGVEDKINSYSYFDENLIVNDLYDIDNDYFLSYFTRETINHEGDEIKIPREYKYSKFYINSDNLYPETLFRGVKIQLKERSEYSKLNFDLNKKEFKFNEAFENYRFSAVLTFGESGIEVIKNDKFKNITLVIKSKFDDIFFKDISGNKFIDRLALYNLKDSYEIGGTGDEFLVEKNTIIKGTLNSFSKGSFMRGKPTKINVNLTKDQLNNYPDLINQINLNREGKFGDIVIRDFENLTGAGELKYIRFSGLNIASLNKFYCDKIYYSTELYPTEEDQTVLSFSPSKEFYLDVNKPDSLTENDIFIDDLLLYSTSESVKLRLKRFFIYNKIEYTSGVGLIENEIKDISFSNIAKKINSGDPSVLYKSIKPDGTIIENDFCLELLKPIDNIAFDYKETVLEKTKIYESNSIDDSLNLEIRNKNKLTVSPISRHKGYFMPKFIDVIRFIDDNNYQQTQIYTDTNLGIIKNLHYTKVNRKGNILLKSNLGKQRPLYGDVSVDKKDFYIFKSTFDSNYYDEYLDLKNKIGLLGPVNPIEHKSFMGSKLLSLPDKITISKFSEVFDRTNVIKPISKGYDILPSVKVLNLFLDFKKILTENILSMNIDTAFKYSNFDKSIVDAKSRFIEDYIKSNILEKYIIKEIIFWEKLYKEGESWKEIENSLSDQEKIEAGFIKSKNYSLELKLDSNAVLKYNIPRDKKYSLSLTFIIEKIKTT